VTVAEWTNILALAVVNTTSMAGGNLGYGVNLAPGDTNTTIKARVSPYATAIGALIIVLATTLGQSTTFTLDPAGDAGYTIAAQGGGIVMSYQISAFLNVPFCQTTPPLPSFVRSDTSAQWLLLTAPFQPNGEQNPFGAPPSGLTSLQQIEQFPLPVGQPSTPNLVM
jgi:hypothetical protein